MKITVKLFATLRTGRFDENVFDVDTCTDIDCLLEKINLKREEVAIIFINGIHGDYNSKVSENDIVSLFPPIGGG